MILSIIIVSWNVKPLLERCLSSIFRNNKDLDYEILVIDNASKDSSQEYLKAVVKKNHNLKIILNKNNPGFAKANNQGIAHAKGEFILFLNPDTEVYGGTLQKSINFMQKKQDCGILGCQLVGVDDIIQPSVRKFPTVASQVMIFLKLHYLFPNADVLKNYFQYDFDYYKSSKVDQVMGAFLMARRKVIQEIGTLDENFFLWFEEVDFCKRAKDAGWEVVYNSEPRTLHHGSQSFGQVLSLRKQRIYNRSAVYYFKKHFSFKYYWPLVVFRPLSLFLAYLTQIFKVSERYEPIRRTRFR